MLSTELRHELECMGDFLARLDQKSARLGEAVAQAARSPPATPALRLECQPLDEQAQLFADLLRDLRALDHGQRDRSGQVRTWTRERQALRTDVDGLDRQIDSLSQELERQRDQVQSMEERLEREGTDWATQREELQQYGAKYRKFLGLYVTPTAVPTIIFELDHLDPQALARRFLCEIQTSHEADQKPFTVVRCEPPLESIQALEDLLNETRDLSGFVVTLRKKFKLSLQE